MKRRELDQILYRELNSWLHPSDCKISEADIQEMLECVRLAIELTGCRYKRNLLLASFVYADRYVKKKGTISRDNMLYFLLVTAIISVKFLSDISDMDLSCIAYVASIDKHALLSLERKFLVEIDYRLFISHEEFEERYKKPQIIVAPS